MTGARSTVDAVKKRLPGVPDRTAKAIARLTERALDSSAAMTVTDVEVAAWVQSLNDTGVFAMVRREARRLVWRHLRASPPEDVDLEDMATQRRLVELTHAVARSTTFQRYIARQVAVMALTVEQLQTELRGASASTLEKHLPAEKLGRLHEMWDANTPATLAVRVGLPAFVDVLVQGVLAVCARPEAWQTVHLPPDLEGVIPSLSLPTVTDVFAGGSALVPTFQTISALLDAIHNADRDGAWTDHNGATPPTHKTPTGRGSGAVYVSARGPGGSGAPSADVLPALWEKVRAMDDLTSDTLLVCLAQWVAKREGPDSPVWITADAVLDARGVRRKQYQSEGKRWAHGHRTEDRIAVGRALVQLDNLWLHLVNVEVGRIGSKRKPRPINIESKALAMIDRAIQAGFDGESVFLAARVMPGVWASAYREAGIQQTGFLAQKALAYDPYREQPEKRLAKFLAFQSRIDAHNGRETLDRRVGTLLDNAGLTPDPGHPDRSRQRLERALKRLQDDGIIERWCYARQRPLPPKRWLDAWQNWIVRITPRALEREAYERFRSRGVRPLPAGD